MRVQGGWHRVGTDRELAGHTEMNDQVKSFGHGASGSLQCAILLEEQHEEFAATLNLNDAATRNVLFDRRGIVDEIRLAQANAEYAAARKQRLKAADDRFDFGKFGQASVRQNGENTDRTAGTAFEFYGCSDDKGTRGGQLIHVRYIFDVKQARRKRRAVHFEIRRRTVIDAQGIDTQAADVARDQQFSRRHGIARKVHHVLRIHVAVTRLIRPARAPASA